MSTYLLAIDDGSQSTKVSILDDRGVVHATGRAALAPYVLGVQGHAVHPGDDLWDTLVLAVRRALAGFDGEVGEIAAVGLCGIRSCRALLDADGRLTEPVLSWMDARVAQPLGDVAPEVDLVTSAGGYLAVRLSGARRDSAASYAGMWPIDIHHGAWDPESHERTGMAPHLLPDLVAPGDLLGPLTREAASATGLVAGTPVHATANDKAVEALGCGVLDPGTTLLSLGTYIAAMRPGPWAETPDPSYWVNAAAMPGCFLHESAGIRRGMWTVSWVRRLVTAARAATTSGPGEPDALDDDAVQVWLESSAREVAPGCAGLLTLPDWLPPQDAPHRRGTVVGYDARHTPAHLYRSVLEGIALTMHTHVVAMERDQGTPARLLVSGGGSRSPLMMQVVADVFARPAERPAQPDGAGVGAAICAAVGAGVHPDFPAAVAAMVPAGSRFDPDPQAVEAYAGVREAHEQVRAHTDAMYRRLAALR